jgi:16S rRNA (uracil1498-N3)-methyltransferase
VTRLPLRGVALNEPVLSLDTHALHYLRDVRRLGPGDTVVAFDGLGNEVEARLAGDAESLHLVTVGGVRAGRVGADVRLVYGLPRGEKLDDVLRQVTELGVAGIVLLSTERSVSRLDDDARADKKRVRWARILDEAARQSGRADTPSLDGPIRLEDYLSHSVARRRLVLHPVDGAPFPTNVGDAGVDVLVGPEGGFSPRELEALTRADVTRATLRSPVLRTETAAVVASALALAAVGAL